MNSARYTSFRDAADTAFLELDAKNRQLVFVVPAQDQGWRIIYSLNKSALRSQDQLSWASMWEQISHQAAEQRKDFLWMRLKQLTGEKHPLALRAIHDLEFSNDGIIRKNHGIGRPSDKEDYVADHTGYGEGGENFEHDDTGALMNYSGVQDETYNAIKEHEDWKKGYDY